MAVALVAEVHAVRVLKALPADVDPAVHDRMASALEAGDDWLASMLPMNASLEWAFRELLRRDRDVRETLAALRSGKAPARTWRTPFYACHRLAAETGVRAALWIALASVTFILAGWPAASASLILITAFMGLGVITPNPRGFTMAALIGCPIGALLAGVLDFLVLGDVTAFPLLALGLAPFMIGAAVLSTLSNPLLAGIGRMNLIVILVVAALANQQTYNAEVFLETALLVCLGPFVLLVAQILVPPVSDERRRRLLLASARREVGCAQPYEPEEAIFRDAVRIGQMAGAGRIVLEEALQLFDRGALIRLSEASLRGLPAVLAHRARRALVDRDAQSVRRVAADIQEAAPATSRALEVASLVIEEKAP
jgi:hypothetical protein